MKTRNSRKALALAMDKLLLNIEEILTGLEVNIFVAPRNGNIIFLLRGLHILHIQNCIFTENGPVNISIIVSPVRSTYGGYYGLVVVTPPRPQTLDRSHYNLKNPYRIASIFYM